MPKQTGHLAPPGTAVGGSDTTGKSGAEVGGRVEAPQWLARGDAGRDVRDDALFATRLSVVVPTRDEEDNVASLATRLSAALARGARWELVVVDDSSDTTPQRVEELGRIGLPCRLLRREPGERAGGLGGAVLRGFEVAEGDVLVVMDADLQHPPELVPTLASIVAMGAADLAIASRYSAGGSAVGLDGSLRWTISEMSRLAARFALPGARRVHDPLSGFFALRRSVLATGPRSSDGFKILLDILVRGSWERAIEVPFEIAPRVSGASKAGVEEGVRFLRQLGRLRLR